MKTESSVYRLTVWWKIVKTIILKPVITVLAWFIKYDCDFKRDVIKFEQKLNFLD